MWSFMTGQQFHANSTVTQPQDKFAHLLPNDQNDWTVSNLYRLWLLRNKSWIGSRFSHFLLHKIRQKQKPLPRVKG
jgi:hypothetical protein